MRIRGKLLAVVMAATASALLMAGSVLLAAEWVRLRQELRRDLEALASIAVEQTSASLAFQDPESASEVLRSLRSKPHVLAACLYQADGAVFASFQRRGSLGRCPPARYGEGSRFGEGLAELWRPVVVGGRQAGTVLLRSDLGWVWRRLRLQGLILTAALAFAALGAFLLSLRLQRVIAGPVEELADVTAMVRVLGDYSVRATPSSDDEVGVLVDGFNRMLAQIQQRDAALLAAKGVLEERVEERTRALAEELRERRRTEAELELKNRDLEASNRELDDFAYIASHDLKEPLRGIHNYAGFLIEDYQDSLDADGRAKLATLMRLSRRMETLIDTLLHYSRVGRVDLAWSDVDLDALVRELIESLQPSLAPAGAEVHIANPLPTVRCDRARIDEVFRNLIVNAVKYNEAATPRVEIGALPPGSAAGSETPPLEAGPVFYVRDNGIGIPARHQDVVFDIFKRLHGRDAFGGGSGAGLTIVKKVVERHGGRIWLESTPGEGSTFYFTLRGSGRDGG